MSNAEARAWWTDVQHLHPDADGPENPQSRTGRITGRPLPADRQSRREDADQHQRVGRIAGRPVRTRGAEPRLARADAADFADALDLDGAFGTPRRDREPVVREIVLTRTERPETVDAEVIEFARATPAPEPIVADAARALEHEALLEPKDTFERGPDGRRTVQITGRGVTAPSPRRLHEVERRRPNRRAVDRVASRPDRIALWAVLLGIALVVIAAASSSAQAAGF